MTKVVNINGFANVTQDTFKPVWSSGLTMANSVVFLILFSVLMIALVWFLIRVTRKVTLKRNQKILCTMTGIFVIIQIVLLLSRLVSDSLQIVARLRTEQNNLMIEWELFVAVQVFAGLITYFMLCNFVILIGILFFVQRML